MRFRHHLIETPMSQAFKQEIVQDATPFSAVLNSTMSIQNVATLCPLVSHRLMLVCEAPRMNRNIPVAQSNTQMCSSIASRYFQFSFGVLCVNVPFNVPIIRKPLSSPIFGLRKLSENRNSGPRHARRKRLWPGPRSPSRIAQETCAGS